MFLRYFYDKSLAHASYLVGCQRTGEAIVIDPGRFVDPYIEAAKAEGLTIVGAAETHIHADFVSGARELVDRLGATFYISDAGPVEWKYTVPSNFPVRRLADGSSFSIGNILFQVMHTPGHTPESISFLLTDQGGGADEPMGIFTGDFVFVGSIGRPDLLETAVGVSGSARHGAEQLFQSLQKFKSLPDHLQIWPSHGAGSACGKGLGAIPSSTVGYEKRFNPAFHYENESEFISYILEDQPETPFYFAVMKEVNKIGPTLLKDLSTARNISAKEFSGLSIASQVIDTRRSIDFAEHHIPKTMNIPTGMLVRWAGFFVDYTQGLVLISTSDQLTENLRALRSIGIDRIVGIVNPEDNDFRELMTESYATKSPELLRPGIESGTVQLIDVRSQSEWDEGRIAQAKHFFLGYLARHLSLLPQNTTIAVQCLSGARSAIGASILQKAGFQVINMQGGYQGWLKACLPVVHDIDLTVGV